MNTFIETIKVTDGHVNHLAYHEQRVHRTLGQAMKIPLPDSSTPHTKGIFKHRIVYNTSGQIIQQSTTPYTLRPIQSVRLINCDTIDYAYKYEDRRTLNRLFAQRGAADDILIVKEGYLTDSSYCNLVVENAEGLFTPSHPLLLGTKRQYLLDQQIIQPRLIRPADLKNYTTLYLINSMIELGELKIPIIYDKTKRLIF